MGLNGMMMSRIDYQEELKFLKNKQMQFLWELPHNRLLFTHLLFFRYVAPEEFRIDYRFSNTDFQKYS